MKEKRFENIKRIFSARCVLLVSYANMAVAAVLAVATLLYFGSEQPDFEISNHSLSDKLGSD